MALVYVILSSFVSVLNSNPMILNILKQFNWFDFLLIVIFIRTCLVALKRGFAIEIFKLLGTIVAIFLAFHYYTAVSDFLNERSFWEVVPLEFFDFLVFASLVVLGYLSILIIRFAILRMAKIEAISLLNKWGGLLIGLFRSLLLTSLVAFMLTISTISYLSSSVKDSYFGTKVIQVDISTYKTIWYGVYSKFFPNSRINPVIDEVMQILEK